VKAAFDRHHFPSARDAQRQFQGVFVGLGARADEERGVEPHARKPGEPQRGAGSYIERHGIALEDQ
jgi:hypothetical protein